MRLINLKQYFLGKLKAWGLDFTSDMIPIHGLKHEVDTSLGIEAQYNDIHEIMGDLKRTIDMVEMIDYAGMVWDDHIAAFKKLGPTVVNTGNWNEDFEPEPIDMERLPGIVFLATSVQEEWLEIIKRGGSAHLFMYGLKVEDRAINKDPDAALYIVGEYIRWKKSGFWTAFYVTIKDGQLKCVPKVDGKPQKWLNKYAKIKNHSYERMMRDTNKVCAGYFNLWQRRDQYWRFSAHTPNARVSFLINPTDPKRIFANRKVKARTPTGQKKKIIHYVSGHNRNIKGKQVWIKPHLRGLRSFYWGGVYCSVLAPQFHAVNADDWQAKGHFKSGADTVDISTVADMLAKGETHQDFNKMDKYMQRRKGKMYRKLRRQKLRDKMRETA